jgi:hypothetical protein
VSVGVGSYVDSSAVLPFTDLPRLSAQTGALLPVSSGTHRFNKPRVRIGLPTEISRRHVPRESGHPFRGERFSPPPGDHAYVFLLWQEHGHNSKLALQSCTGMLGVYVYPTSVSSVQLAGSGYVILEMARPRPNSEGSGSAPAMSKVSRPFDSLDLKASFKIEEFIR